MFGTLGFSYIGLLFLCCLFVPNILFVKHAPKDPVHFKQNRFLLTLERAGQALCTTVVLIFDDFNMHALSPWTLWLAAAFVLMALYLLCWARYFRGAHETMDFLRPLFGIPLPLATLPVAAVFLLSVYGRVLMLSFASVLLGIGHIGITAQHWNALLKNKYGAVHKA